MFLEKRLVSFALIFLLSGGYVLGQGAYFDASVLKDPTGYKLRPGDRIRVVIQGETDCSTETSLTNEGTINMPYVGELRLMGKNKKEAESSIEREYKKELIFARPKALIAP